jgi:tRNA pseudouridine55 synthase
VNVDIMAVSCHVLAYTSESVTLTGMKHKIQPGFLLINKPIDITSFDCIRVLRRRLPGGTKIGHAGTLDDFASGLLIVCIGREATRLVGSLMGLTKEYVVTAKLGELTDSLDYNGKLVEQSAAPMPSRQDLEQALRSLQPSYLQIPPVYSALKHEGQPLYHLARTGAMEHADLSKIVEQKGREVHIYEASLIDYQAPLFTIQVSVSKGTYVRSLANDMAQWLGLPATTYQLERTKIGSLHVSSAHGLEAFVTLADVEQRLIPVSELQERLQAA